jgi:hypothetical protein
MTNDIFRLRRYAAIFAAVVVVAMVFLALWAASADHPWSSDPWLIYSVIAFVLGGPSILLLIAFLLSRKK